jgi:hypothetical protein
VGALWDEHAERLRNAQVAREIAASQQLSGSSTTVEPRSWRFQEFRLGPAVRRDHAGRLVVNWQRPDETFMNEDSDEFEDEE